MNAVRHAATWSLSHSNILSFEKTYHHKDSFLLDQCMNGQHVFHLWIPNQWIVVCSNMTHPTCSRVHWSRNPRPLPIFGMCIARKSQCTRSNMVIMTSDETKIYQNIANIASICGGCNSPKVATPTRSCCSLWCGPRYNSDASSSSFPTTKLGKTRRHGSHGLARESSNDYGNWAHLHVLQHIWTWDIQIC